MTPSDVSTALSAQGYLPDDGISTSVFLAMTLQRPLLLEGEAGVGKTELAKALSAVTGGELIRLQCYEGIDVSQAVYDWDYARQLLHLRAAEATGETASMTSDALEAELYSERFMIKRALLRAIETVEGPPPVLLIDEVDRAVEIRAIAGNRDGPRGAALLGRLLMGDHKIERLEGRALLVGGNLKAELFVDVGRRDDDLALPRRAADRDARTAGGKR